MRGSVTLIASLLLFATAAAVSRDAGRAAAAAPAAPDTGALSRGAKAWAENCGVCHNLRSPDEFGDVQAEVAVAHMRVRARLPGDVARDILAFLQASNGRQAAAIAPAAPPTSSTVASAGAVGDPVRGAQIYQETCVACHGPNGKGALDGVPDLTDPAGRLAQADEVVLRHMIDGLQSPGSPMPMPPKGGNPDLSDQDMRDVLAHLRKDFAGR
ncbi:MAG: cytochrome c [Qipengyuania sp.]|nr:cytochrome c [Qipengyuania sp.]